MRRRIGIPCAAALVALLAAAGPGGAQVVQGSISDAGTGAPLGGVTVTMVSPNDAVREAVRTDSTGRFMLLLDGPGVYRVRAQSGGYRPAVSNLLSLAPSDTLDVEIRLSQQVVLLDSIHVVAPARRRHTALLRDFYQRSAQGLFGHFVTRDEIVRIPRMRTTDLLATVPGVQLTPARMGGGAEIYLRGGCSPTLYVDGVRVPLRGLTVDDLVRPSEIEGIEFYRSVSEAPPQYQGLLGGCSTLLVWTRIE